ncbi:hypothetical protein GJ496_006283 [Pomphorhynchus laevis]|nr:hypothetical protein GJ496_006283 [Pomphorhynchus laevis]
MQPSECAEENAAHRIFDCDVLSNLSEIQFRQYCDNWNVLNKKMNQLINRVNEFAFTIIPSVEEISKALHLNSMEAIRKKFNVTTANEETLKSLVFQKQEIGNSLFNADYIKSEYDKLRLFYLKLEEWQTLDTDNNA